MRTLKSTILLVLTGMTVFLLISKPETGHAEHLNETVEKHVEHTIDSINSLNIDVEEVGVPFLDSLLTAEKERLISIKSDLEEAGEAELYVVEKTCDEVLFKLNSLLDSLAGVQK